MKTFVCTTILLTLACAAHSAEVGLRIRLGVTDKEPAKWDGSIAVTPGRVAAISGWRFADGDQVTGNVWKASTRRAAPGRRSNNPGKAKAGGGAGPVVDNGVLVTLADVGESSTVEITTPKGKFSFKLSEVPYGKVIEQQDGAVEIERTAAARQLSTGKTDDDYPAAAVARDGTVYVAWVSFTPGLDRDQRARSWDEAPKDLSFLDKLPGGDQVWVQTQKNGRWSEPVAVTGGRGDIYKCAVTVDGSGEAWIFWSENKSWPDKKDANFEIYARSLKDGKLSEPVNVSGNAGSDVNAVAATDSNGRVWVAWQAARDGVFRIVERHQAADGKWSDERRVSTQNRNCWTPAIAATAQSGGRIAIAWDTYEKGDYDVWVRDFSADGKAGESRAVTSSPDYEARPALTFDNGGALWIAWEQSGPTWGKDWGALVRDKGIGLYRDRQIGLRILKDGAWLEPEKSFASHLPGAVVRRNVKNQRVPALEPESETRKAGEEAEARRNLAHNNLARIVCDAGGQLWLFSRSRQNDFRSPLGSLWLNWAAYFDGNAWVGPILVPHSDNLLYNVPAVVPLPDGGLFLAHSTDHRQDRRVVRRGGGGNASLDSDQDPFDNDVFVSLLELAGKVSTAGLKPAANLPDAQAAPSPATRGELAGVERARAYRANIGGRELRIIRGEFHRHTEISGDGGNDGPLEDMWRYAIDVAEMDWLGCGDHDNGGGREYPWWLTQKTTDAFRLPGRFEPPFTYERSVRYPEGHRNVVFAQRGVRTLPRLPISNRDQEIHAPDTQMLYKYLHQFGGVCASHTSATSMGTDWRDNDPVVEPMVEIYQGCRQNYERPGAPRCPTADDAIGGWEPKGFVNLALLKGYRMSFQSSSDHGSTHISYALVYATDNSREALLDGMRKRHTYAATDNIIADFRCKAGGIEHMMGDEFSTAEAPKLTVKLVGTGPFAKVTLVKDDVEIPLGQPNTTEFETAWTDPKPEAGKTSYYYVRGEQANGEIVWVSPMWIKYQPK